MDSREVCVSDPRVYAVKNDPHMPSVNSAVHGEFSEQYVESIQKHIAALIHQNTWISVSRNVASNSSSPNRASKLKHFPDGTLGKFKARFCVRWKLQKEGVNYFETTHQSLGPRFFYYSQNKLQ